MIFKLLNRTDTEYTEEDMIAKATKICRKETGNCGLARHETKFYAGAFLQAMKEVNRLRIIVDTLQKI